MKETSRFSHAMIKVPSVDDAAAYFISKGGRITQSRSNGETNGEEELLSAFVELGSTTKNNDDTETKSFALELIKSSGDQTPNESVSGRSGLLYLGLSLLLKMQDESNNNPLLELMKGIDNANDAAKDPFPHPGAADDAKDDDQTSNDKEQLQQSESSVLPIKYVASAPGDGFAQVALACNDKLVETCDFYTSLLGMDQKAQDGRLLCLRYDDNNSTEDDKENSSAKTNGVATTLVFENCPSESDGETNDNCLDHLAIETTSSIQGLYQSILDKNEASKNVDDNNDSIISVYLEPTPMFGSTVLGLIDPNGYQVVVYGKTP